MPKGGTGPTRALSSGQRALRGERRRPCAHGPPRLAEEAYRGRGADPGLSAAGHRPDMSFGQDAEPTPPSSPVPYPAELHIPHPQPGLGSYGDSRERVISAEHIRAVLIL